jgi:hypothetical protein
MDRYGIRSECVFADFATGLIILYSLWIATSGAGVHLCRAMADNEALSVRAVSGWPGCRDHSKEISAEVPKAVE